MNTIRRRKSEEAPSETEQYGAALYFFNRPYKKSRLIPDFNHDRTITEEDYAQSITNGPFRFWINDDDDKSEDAKTGGDNDTPGDGAPDYDNYYVDDMRDLIDFFPVFLDLTNTLDLLGTANYDFSIHLEGNPSLSRHRMSLLFTDLTPGDAGDYLVDHTVAASLDDEDVEHFGYNNNVVDIDESFLQDIRDDGKGVVLIEACTATLGNRLVVEIKDSNNNCIGSMGFALNADSVENMYRWINLREAGGGKVEKDTFVGCPTNYPDSLCSDKNFIFVHGYCVREDQALGWAAEMFKRFYWAGSRAKFTAVTWFGDDSKIPSWMPKVGDATPNYYRNVEHAFASADELKDVVTLNLAGPKYIAAHSLGNMLVSSAIVDHSLNVNAYFMLNAAVAMEAYDVSLSDRNNLRNPTWQIYSNRLWASDWHELYQSDYRGDLTWRDRFGNISVAHNYYSEGEDVLNNGNGTMPDIGGECAWVSQEMHKGTWMIKVGPGNSEAGWGFNKYYDNVIIGYDQGTGWPIYGKIPATQANVLAESVLRTNSFFRRFDDDELYETSGSTFLLDGEVSIHHSAVYSRLLADAIPALSQPMGRNRLDLFTYSRNEDMNSMQNDWPYCRTSDPDFDDRWLHSDIKNIAFPYVYEVFDDIATKGLR